MCSAHPTLAVFPWRAEPMPRQSCHRNLHSTALRYRLYPRRHAVHLTGSARVFRVTLETALRSPMNRGNGEIYLTQSS